MKILLEIEPSEIQTELKDLTDAQLMYVRDAAEAHLDARGIAGQVDAIVMVPFLKNYADGVDGHFCIARKHPEGYNEFWNEKHNKWCSEASVFKIGKAP